MRASSFKSRNEKWALLSATNTQQDLFDHSVIAHTEVARPLCPHRAPKARCMMTIENTAKVRKTYPQEWHEYNLAQTHEKSRFVELLFALCEGVEEPLQTMGRPRARVADIIFAACMKIYGGMSGRRSQS